MIDFLEGEKVQLVEMPSVVGTVDIVREYTDPDTDRPTCAPSYDVAWEDGEYSTHDGSELVALSEEYS